VADFGQLLSREDALQEAPPMTLYGPLDALDLD
jgi:hypothetical protein